MTETLMWILKKLAQALAASMGRILARGRKLALSASSFAVEWGNPLAYSWRFEHGFCKALGLGIVTERGAALPLFVGSWIRLAGAFDH